MIIMFPSKLNPALLSPYIVSGAWFLIAGAVALAVALGPDSQAARILYATFLCSSLIFISAWPYAASSALGNASAAHRNLTLVGIIVSSALSFLVLTKNTSGPLPMGVLAVFFAVLLTNINGLVTRSKSTSFMFVFCMLILFPVGVFPLNSWVRRKQAA
jgi:hypothetical protein